MQEARTRGYHQGYSKGIQNAHRQGVEMGVLAGFNVYCRIGWYKASCTRLLRTLSDQSPKVKYTLSSIISLCDSFPRCNDANADFSGVLLDIEGKWKMLRSLIVPLELPLYTDKSTSIDKGEKSLGKTPANLDF